MSDNVSEDHDDLGALAERVERNYRLTATAIKQADDAQHRADNARKRLTVLTVFVLFAFLLLAYRTEVANGRIATTQGDACQSSLEISRQFNRGQDALIAIERKNTALVPALREARIKVYQDVRIDPLPICDPL